MSSGSLSCSRRSDKENTLPRAEALASENATPPVLRYDLRNDLVDHRGKYKISKFPFRLG
jgi:hypothetical protein